MTQPESAETLGAWVRACRQRRGMTQQAYAALLGYTVETLRKVERDRYLSHGFVERLAEIEAVPLDQLMRLAQIAEQPGAPSTLPSLPAPHAPGQRGTVAIALAAFLCGVGVALLFILRSAPQPAALVPTPARNGLATTQEAAATALPAASATVVPSPTTPPAPTPTPTERPSPSATPQPTPSQAPTATLVPTRPATATPQPSPLPTDTPIPTATRATVLQDIPVPLVGNDNIQSLLPQFATGERVFDGVRFEIGEPPNKLSTQCDANRDWPEEVTIAVKDGVADAQEVFLLLNAGYTGGAEGNVIGQIELVFADRASPPAYQIVLGENVRNWLLDRDPTEIRSPELHEVYRGDSSFNVNGVIDRLQVPIPEEYKHAVLRGIVLRDTSRTSVSSRDPCLFTTGVTVRARQ